MLQSIRDRTQGWIASIIISMIILSFALWGVHSYMEGGASDTSVANVNGVDIYKQELQISYERLKRQAQMSLGLNLTPDLQTQLKDKALQTLINIEILKQSSLQQKYLVTNPQVEAYLESMPEFQINGQFSLNKFNQVLSSALYSAENFFELLRATLLIDQPRFGIMLSSFALPNEIDNSLMLLNQQREVEYVLIPNDYISKLPVNLSENEINAYYKANQEKYKTPEQISIEYIELSTKALVAQQKTTEAELQNYYNENINTYTEPTQFNISKIIIPFTNESDKGEKKAQDFYLKVKIGKDFNLVAEQNNPKLFVMKQQWTNAGELPDGVQQQIKNSKVNDILAPVKTDKGFEIVKVIEIKKGEIKPFEKVKQDVSLVLNKQKAEEQFAEMREKLANAAYQYPDALSKPANEMRLPIKTTSLFSREKGALDISANQKVREVAFSEDVLTAQNNSDVIQIDPETAIVLRIKDHKPSSVLSLQDVKGLIEKDLTQLKRNDSAKAIVTDINKSLVSGITPEQLKNKYPSLTTEQPFWVARYSDKIDPSIVEAAFRLPSPKSNTSNYVTVKTPKGYALVRIINIRTGEKLTDKDKLNAFADQAKTLLGSLEYKLYEKSFIDKAKVTKHQT